MNIFQELLWKFRGPPRTPDKQIEYLERLSGEKSISSPQDTLEETSEHSPDEGRDDSSVQLIRKKWKVAVKYYMTREWKINIQKVNEVWENLTQTRIRDEPSRLSSSNRGVARDATRTLFDFSTRAVTYSRGSEPELTDRMHTRRNGKNSTRTPHGLNVHQNMFLDEPQIFPDESSGGRPYRISRGSELDDVARAFADVDGYDGIYCLCGVRGSGKSTVLNRIAWYCRNWQLDNGKSLLVRFDLGTDFDRDAFLRDLAAEVCLGAKDALRYPPYTIRRGLGWVTKTAGHLARFCQANIPWAAIAMILIVLLVQGGQIQYQHEVMNGSAAHIGYQTCQNSNQNGENSTSRDRNNEWRVWSVLFSSSSTKCVVSDDKNASFNHVAFVDVPLAGHWKVRDVQLLLFGLIGAIVLGVLGNIRQYIPNEGGQHGKGSRWFLNIFMSIVSIGCIVVAFVLMLRDVMWSMESSEEMYIYGWCLLSLSVAVAVIPRWWESYMFFDRTLTRIRTERGQKMLDGPLFTASGSFGWFLARILPSTDDPNQMDKVSEPFVQELTKDVMEECRICFDRTVILIDDVDALPSDRFGEIIRLLRPISKMKNVRCIVASPLFFHYVLRSQELGDIHSTVQDTIVVGNNEIFHRWPDEPKSITRDPEILRNFLVDLMISRLKVKLEFDDEHIRKEQRRDRRDRIAQLEPFKFILEPWLSSENSRQVNEEAVEIFSRFGTSRRELIRILEMTLDHKYRGETKVHLREAIPEVKDNLVYDLKREYWQQEESLNCNVENIVTVDDRSVEGAHAAGGGRSGTKKRVTARKAAAARGKKKTSPRRGGGSSSSMDDGLVGGGRSGVDQGGGVEGASVAGRGGSAKKKATTEKKAAARGKKKTSSRRSGGNSSGMDDGLVGGGRSGVDQGGGVEGASVAGRGGSAKKKATTKKKAAARGKKKAAVRGKKKTSPRGSGGSGDLPGDT